MWLVSSRENEGLLEHVEYEYKHCSSLLFKEITHVVTAPRCKPSPLPYLLCEKKIYIKKNLCDQLVLCLVQWGKLDVQLKYTFAGLFLKWSIWDPSRTGSALMTGIWEVNGLLCIKCLIDHSFSMLHSFYLFKSTVNCIKLMKLVLPEYTFSNMFMIANSVFVF